MDFHDYKNKIILEKFLEYRKEKYRYKYRDKYWIISFIVSSTAYKISLLYSVGDVNNYCLQLMKSYDIWLLFTGTIPRGVFCE